MTGSVWDQDLLHLFNLNQHQLPRLLQAKAAHTAAVDFYLAFLIFSTHGTGSRLHPMDTKITTGLIQAIVVTETQLNQTHIIQTAIIIGEVTHTLTHITLTRMAPQAKMVIHLQAKEVLQHHHHLLKT